ncbi:MAG: hypothetical protein QUS33_09880 [Dehalococcoidia bacterium]|nr:hypothetical protein [Dehalococcoidia bacterium]
MPLLLEKAQTAWTEMRESCEIVLEIEKEGLKLLQSETERSCCLVMNRLLRRKDQEVFR